MGDSRCFLATVAVFGKRRQSPFLATVAEFGDYSRQCGQGFTQLAHSVFSLTVFNSNIFSKISYNRPYQAQLQCYLLHVPRPLFICTHRLHSVKVARYCSTVTGTSFIHSELNALHTRAESNARKQSGNFGPFMRSLSCSVMQCLPPFRIKCLLTGYP